mmetsp:Transcript_37429/g.67033  ORF Transcript_37429/g.67033 Transcript_37429/m.67033 type:complete len:211 (+) Transcript_37429:464-1096(+)
MATLAAPAVGSSVDLVTRSAACCSDGPILDNSPPASLNRIDSFTTRLSAAHVTAPSAAESTATLITGSECARTIRATGSVGCAQSHSATVPSSYPIIRCGALATGRKRCSAMHIPCGLPGSANCSSRSREVRSHSSTTAGSPPAVASTDRPPRSRPSTSSFSSSPPSSAHNTETRQKLYASVSMAARAGEALESRPSSLHSIASTVPSRL